MKKTAFRRPPFESCTLCGVFPEVWNKGADASGDVSLVIGSKAPDSEDKGGTPGGVPPVEVAIRNRELHAEHQPGTDAEVVRALTRGRNRVIITHHIELRLRADRES